MYENSRMFAGAMKSQRVIVAAILLSSTAVGADDEAGNSPRVFASRYGNCYAKSVPAEAYGDKGVTQVFIVSAGTDNLADTYNWYAPQLFLECNVAPVGKPVAVAVARIGSWPRGRRASAVDLAVAFYREGLFLKQYSTLDIAGAAENVRASMSHYVVLGQIDGYRWKNANEYHFQLRTIDGRNLSFDASTGESLSDQRPGVPAPAR
ncbi:MAG: hypothetical protein ABI619_02995 [Betaproteobacteria bacterium]